MNLKTITSLSLVLFSLGIFSIQLASGVPAQTGVIENDCYLEDGIGEFVVTDSFNIVTNSQNNNITLLCQATNIENPTGHAIIDQGFLCFVGDFDGNFFETTNSHQIISASGEATLICHYKSI